jgi:pilus assembly protein CpaF
VAKSVADRVVGAGPLQPYFDDPEVEEIWINEPGKVFVAKAGRPRLTTTVLSEQQAHDLVELILRTSGRRRVDLSSPFVDATQSDGSRRHWAANIRDLQGQYAHTDTWRWSAAGGWLRARRTWPPPARRAASRPRP